MVRRLRADIDHRQLGLFGADLALGMKLKVLKGLPVQSLGVVLPTVDRPKMNLVLSAPASNGEVPARAKRLSSLPPEIVQPPEAASLLSVSLSLLKKWHMGEDGPRFVKLGGRAIGYRRLDLLEWIEGRTR